MNRVLLDTHALVDFVGNTLSNRKLSERLDDALASRVLFVSSISFWELGLLVQRGRIYFKDLSEWRAQVLHASQMQLLSPSIDEMITSTKLPLHHKDPFDRLLVSQAKFHDMVLVSRDKFLQKYKIKIVWD